MDIWMRMKKFKFIDRFRFSCLGRVYYLIVYE